MKKILMRAMAACAALLALSVFAESSLIAQQRWHKDYFPNVELVNQDGRKMRFYDDVIKGKTVAISFIYTHCQDVCPLDTASLRRVQQLVGDRMGRDVFFYSISIDPANDTPAVMKGYMKTFAIGPGWTFLTGRPQDIALIQRRLGITPVAPEALGAHDTRFILGNEAMARWIKRTPHDNPEVLANILTRELSSPGMPRDNTPRRSYAEARNITGLTSGASLFMSRCAACHSIGRSDGPLGPDLAGVTERRSRAWLVRWIREPDRMRAEKDPATVALMARYRNLPMPNLRLGEDDAAGLIEFISAETRRLRSATDPHAGHAGHSH